MKKLYWLIGIIFLSISCTVDTPEKYGASDFRVYSVNPYSKEIPFYSMVDQVEVIPLEETEKHYIGTISSSQIDLAHIAIFDGTQMKLSVFNREGKLLHAFSHKGDGPTEYKNLRNIQISGDSLIVLDAQRNRIVYYSLDGQFLKATKIKELSPIDLTSIDDGYYLQLYSAKEYDSKLFEVVRVDPNFENPFPLIPYETLPNATFATKRSFETSSHGVAHVSAYTDTVFLLKGNEAKPWIKFDFGGLWAPYLIKDNPNFIKDFMKKESARLLSLSMTSKWIYGSYSCGKGGRKNFILDLEEGKIKHVSFKSQGQKNWSLSHQGSFSQEFIYFSSSSDNVRYLLESLNASQWSISRDLSIDEIEASENPVLLRVKFK